MKLHKEKLNISELIKEFPIEYIGDFSIEIDGISSSANPKPNSLIYVISAKFIPNIDSKHIVLLTDKCLKDKLNFENILFSDNPRLIYAHITKYFSCKSNLYKKSPIFTGLTVGKNVVIEENVSIGQNVTIGHNVVIHNNTSIGNNVFIDSGTIIASEGFGNVLDSSSDWQHIYHLGSVVIGNNVMIGANCCIDKGTIDNTIIEDGVIIDNSVHIAHNVKIGEKTAIAAKVGIAGSCNIGKRNMIGGMVGIVDHINTANDVIISATSTVNKDLKEAGVYTGIMPISKHVIWKRIAFWITKLDKMIKLNNYRKKNNDDSNEYQ